MNEKLWLYPENETDFVFNSDDGFLNKLSQINKNKDIINNYLSKDTEFAKSLVKKPKNAFLKAQERMFYFLDKEPYLYSEMLPPLSRELLAKSIEVSDYEKGVFRNAYSHAIQAGYFEPTAGNNVASEVNIALCNFAFVDKKKGQNVFENAAKLNAQIVRIQPFMDGNKRMAGLLTNGMFKLAGYPAIDLCKNDKEFEEYNNALKTAIVKRDVTPLANIFADKVLSQQKNILKKIEADKSLSL